MAKAKITLLGFYEFLQYDDIDLFEFITLPDGLDKETLVGNILMRGGEFEVLFSNPEFFRRMIDIWSKKHYRTFDKWWTALNIEYDPLNNFDRYEEYEDIRDDKEKTELDTKIDTTGKNTTKTDGSINHNVSGFDTGAYTPKDQDVTNNTDTMEGEQHVKNGGSNNRKFDGNLKHKGHLYGNIGVTTSQQMLESELDISAWNIYEKITDLFLEEFVVYTY